MRYGDYLSWTYNNYGGIKDKNLIGNQNYPQITSVHQNYHSYLDIETLQQLVKGDSKKGPILISGTNIEDFLSTVEKDNQRWNISSLNGDEIKDMTESRGNQITFWNNLGAC